MFKQLRNIDSAYRFVRGFSIVFIAVCFILCCFTIWKSYDLVKLAHDKIYVLSNGKAIEAISAERKDNIEIELRDHIKMFHHYFFTLAPDENVIRAGIGHALNLADESAKKAYDNLKEQGFYNNLISANISQEINTDSIAIDLRSYPYTFRYFATEKLIRSSSTLSKKLISEGDVRTTARSENNPHGFLIQRWEIIENSDVPDINSK